MNHEWKYIGIIVSILAMIGCSNHENEIPTTVDGQKLYHEIGDTFEFEGRASGLPFEITVENIWMDDFEEHEAYIVEHYPRSAEDKKVIFISYQVTNKGKNTYEFTDDQFYPNNDVLPNLINPNNMIFDVDIAYADTGVVDDMERMTDLTLEPNEKMNLTGAVITNPETEYDGAFVWDYDADIPQVVFTRSQSERKDQVGVYDMGSPVFISDQNGEQINVTFNDIHDVKSDEDVEYIEREYDSSAFLVLDMIIENSGEEDIGISWAIPQIITNGHHIFQSKYFIKKGETTPIKSIYVHKNESPKDGLIKPGETVEGTLYYEVENMRRHEVMTLDAQVFYSYRGFTDYPYYKQWINYNLD